MCRRNQLLGVAAMAFGVGLMVGGHLATGFWCGFAGFIFLAVGISLCAKKT